MEIPLTLTILAMPTFSSLKAAVQAVVILSPPTLLSKRFTAARAVPSYTFSMPVALTLRVLWVMSAVVEAVVLKV